MSKNKMRTIITMFFFALLLLIVDIFGPAFSPVFLRAADWPQWRGPYFTGSSDEVNLPASWGKSKNIVWVAPLPGPSAATVAVCKGKVFVSSTVKGQKKLVALCFDAETGKKLWQRTVVEKKIRFPRNNPASPSPVADSKKVIFFFGSGDLACFDRTGKRLWYRDLEKDYGNMAIKFGYSSSPLLYANKLYILFARSIKAYRRPGSDKPLDSFLLAINADTGKTIWKQLRTTNAVRESKDAYTTPIPFVRAGGTAEILCAGADFITSSDAQTGKELWRFEYRREKVTMARLVPTLVVGDGLIFGCLGRHKGVFAIKPAVITQGRAENVPDKFTWLFTGPSPDCSTPLFYKGRLYIMYDMASGGIVSCLEPKTGRQIWQKKLKGSGPWWASLTAADDKIYCVSEKGNVIVFAAADEYRELFRTVIEEKPIQSSIVIAQGSLFIRTASNLYCIRKCK